MANAARLSGLVQLCSNASALDLLATAVDRAARSHAEQAAALAAWVSLLLYVGGGDGTTFTVCRAGSIGWARASPLVTAAPTATTNTADAAVMPVR
ncbi:hypothetical protein [Mycolicibacterium pyrenivorans]|uniref:hypothetical protein n=1 Tax=Mycolicibacterium pyrenivorans TaxID=187102 RepID=UPI0021F30F6F|nr:hypothetical protein [Mycolicibacterium pyrenivorans]MCV7152607.1 hypothetical protein [Mycolicibacterium pyrenivorans]